MADFHRLDIQERATKHQNIEKRMDEYWINQVSWCPSDEYFEIGLKGKKALVIDQVSWCLTVTTTLRQEERKAFRKSPF